MKNLLFMSLAMMAEANFCEIQKETRKEPKKVIPKGCKEYVFNRNFGTLKVFAINEKSAFKKYNKWYNQNKNK